MHRFALICGLALTGCSSQPEASCPAIQRLAQRDAVADAQEALARGDRHLLMLGGYVSSVPGVENPGTLPTKMMEGTSDTKTEACERLGAKAEAYAARYNRTIVQAAGS